MSDINLVAYNVFRRDLAKIFRTFNSSTQTDFTEDAGTSTETDLNMEAPSDGNGNPEETPDPSPRKRSPKRTNDSQSEISTECSQTRPLVLQSTSEESTEAPREEVQDNNEHPSETLHPVASDVRHSGTSSIGTIDSGRLSTAESQTSGYTPERVFPMDLGYEPLTQSSSYASIETFYEPPPSNFLREIHVAINPSSYGAEIQSVRADLQELLTNAIFHIRRGNNQAIYIITYNYM